MERNDAADELWRGCRYGCGFWIINGILGIVVSPLLKHAFGQYWLFVLLGGFVALFLWGWWRAPQRRGDPFNEPGNPSDRES